MPTHALDASDTAADPARAVDRLTGGGADHVLECIGLTATVESAIELARPGGTITLVGMTAQADRARVDVYRFVEDGKRLLGSNYGSVVPSRDIPRIARDVVEGRLPLGRLVTGHIPLADIDDALDAMRRRDGARRVITFDPTRRPVADERLRGISGIAPLALRFLLELAGVAALAWWGIQTGADDAGRAVLAIGAAGSLVVVWASWWHPRHATGSRPGSAG